MTLLPKIALVLLLWLGAVTLGTAQVPAVINFANFSGPVNAPFFAAQSTNLLAGSNYVAALYVARLGTGDFALVSPLQRFQTGTAAGRWFPINVFLAGFTEGDIVRVQIRFWDQSRFPSATFEQAEASGAEIGIAELPALVLSPNGVPTPLFGLQSASLIPTLTLTRGAPLAAFDPGATTTGSQMSELCSTPVGNNRWFRLVSPNNAVAALNTDGSSIDTVMTAFTGSIVNLAALTALACNDDRAPNVVTSAFNLPVDANVLYLVCVAGKNGASGPVQLNYATGVSLEIR